MTTGHDITTRIINIVLAEQIDIIPMDENNRLLNYKPWIKSIEKWRDYINKKYLFVELQSPQIQDIFRYLCSEDDWKLSIENKDSVNGYNITKELIAKIEKITKCPGLFVKILNEKEN